MSFNTAVGRAVAAVKCVGRVSPEVAQARLDRCHLCPQLDTERRCQICACYMPAKATCRQERTRSGLRDVACPLGHW